MKPCERLCRLDIKTLIAWVDSIPPDAWPKVPGSMRTLEWQGAESVTRELTVKILKHFPPGSRDDLHYFSYLLPSHRIAPHQDPQPETWICRVHVPIISNLGALINFQQNRYHLMPGWAYKLNTVEEHSIENHGLTPRIHWMFDVHA